MDTPTRTIGTGFETTVKSMAWNWKVCFLCEIAITYAASEQSLCLFHSGTESRFSKIPSYRNFLDTFKSQSLSPHSHVISCLFKEQHKNIEPLIWLHMDQINNVIGLFLNFLLTLNIQNLKWMYHFGRSFDRFCAKVSNSDKKKF